MHWGKAKIIDLVEEHLQTKEKTRMGGVGRRSGKYKEKWEEEGVDHLELQELEREREREREREEKKL